MAAAIVVATYLGLNPPGFAAQTVALAFGLAAASIFPALMMGIFTKVNNKGAVAGMLTGLIVTLIYIFLHKGWFFIPDTNSFTDADPLLGTIKSTSFGAVGAMINFAVAFTVSKMTAPIPQEIEDLVESVRVPTWRGCGAGPLGPSDAPPAAHPFTAVPRRNTGRAGPFHSERSLHHATVRPDLAQFLSAIHPYDAMGTALTRDRLRAFETRMRPPDAEIYA